jgi:hypothetical protein
MNLLHAVVLAGALLAAGDAGAQFRAQDTLPAMYALAEICDQKFPAQREQIARALSEWAVRNERILKVARSSPAFDLDVLALRRSLARQPVDWQTHCPALPLELAKPESDPRDIDYRADAPEIPPGFEVQQVYEMKRICDARHPETKAASDTALSSWAERNRKVIDRERAQDGYKRASVAVRAVLEKTLPVEDLRRTCAEFPSLLTHALLGKPQ